MSDKMCKSGSTGHSAKRNRKSILLHPKNYVYFIVPSNKCKETKGKEYRTMTGFTDNAMMIC